MELAADFRIEVVLLRVDSFALRLPGDRVAQPVRQEVALAAVADRELGAGEAVEVGRLANQAALPVVEQHQVVESRGAALRRTGSLTVVEIASHKVDNQRAALREVFREIEVERRYEAFGAVGQTPRALLLQRVPCKGDAFVGLHPLVVRMADALICRS